MDQAVVRRVAVLLLCALLASTTGCVAERSPATETTVATDRTTSPSSPPSTQTSASTRTTTTDDPCTESGEWLSLSEVSEDEAMEIPAEERVNFSELFPSEQEVVVEALERDCAVHQNAFGFGSDSNPSVIVYDGDYYVVYVGVRTATTAVG